MRTHASGPPLLRSINKPSSGPYDPELKADIGMRVDHSMEHVEALVDAIEEGTSVEQGAHEAVARDTLLQAVKDLDLFVRLGVSPGGDGYPGRHSLHVAMLSSAIGATLGWDERTLIDVGVGCLTHDIGMLRVPDRVYTAERSLDEAEFERVASHPLHTFDMMAEHLSAVPLASRMVAYQIHERCNGSGYPRNRRTGLIHEAAKVAAVADVYIALVSPRPHRPGLMPYYAVEHLLYGVRDGLFDSATVRALLTTISLFPIGSCVELSDGRVGRVLRSDPADYSRPVIESWRPGELDAPPEILDLVTEGELRVRRPLTALSNAAAEEQPALTGN